MQAKSLAERILELHKAAAALNGFEHSLSIAVVYEDAATRRWAKQVCAQVESRLGNSALCCTWWKIHDLNQPGVLAGAASKAMRAEVVLVAIREAESFPLPLYVWLSSWLPHRRSQIGLLAALVTRPATPCAHAGYAGEYLQMVANAARLDYVFEERRAGPSEPSRSSAPVFQPARARTFPLSETGPLSRYSARRWRLTTANGCHRPKSLRA